MLMPRMHLQMLVHGQEFVLDYLQTIAGVFNIAIAIAHKKSSGIRQSKFESGQRIVEALIRDGRVPTEAEALNLCAVFNEADRYLGVQTRSALIGAIATVEAAVKAGDAVLITSQSSRSIE